MGNPAIPREGCPSCGGTGWQSLIGAPGCVGACEDCEGPAPRDEQVPGGARYASIHAYPTAGREHNTNGLRCWCDPSYRQLCPECDDVEGTQGRPGCWLCGGDGQIPCDDPERYDGPHGLIIVHNYPDDG